MVTQQELPLSILDGVIMGTEKINLLLKQLREAVDPNYDEIDLTKVPAEKRAETKSELEKLGVSFVAELEPNYWEVRWDTKGGRHHEIERIRAVASPGGIDDQLDDERSDLEYAAEDKKNVDWDYDVKIYDDHISRIERLFIKFEWKTGSIFTQEEILSALDRWIAEKKPLTISHFVTWNSEDSEGRPRGVPLEATASVTLASKNTEVVVKKPGVYKFEVYESTLYVER